MKIKLCEKNHIVRYFVSDHHLSLIVIEMKIVFRMYIEEYIDTKKSQYTLINILLVSVNLILDSRFVDEIFDSADHLQTNAKYDFLFIAF